MTEIIDEKSCVFMATGTGVDHDAAMQVVRMAEAAAARQRSRKADAVGGFLLGLAGGVPCLPPPAPKTEPSHFEKAQIAAAEAKRERKRQKRAARLETGK